jgi:hypothetical protein
MQQNTETQVYHLKDAPLESTIALCKQHYWLSVLMLKKSLGLIRLVFSLFMWQNGYPLMFHQW